VTTELATIDGEVIEQAAPITLFGTADPVAVVDRASTIATALADVIKRRNLYKHIGQSDHVFVEGWTLLGSMLGVFAEVEWSRPLTGDHAGWECRAVARTLAGATVGAAESMCSRQEGRWRIADDYAIRSMAQTRAVSKALRLPLGFIMELAGYSATPAEELNQQAAPALPGGTPPPPSGPDGREAPGAGHTADPDEAGDGLPAMEAPSPAPNVDPIGKRYEWAAALTGLDFAEIDQKATAATGSTVYSMDSEQWQAFALALKAGALDEPPKPRTEAYKALPATQKAEARAYWQSREVTA
jgi:hypothetical protein